MGKVERKNQALVKQMRQPMTCPVWLRPRWTQRKKHKISRIWQYLRFRASTYLINKYIRYAQTPEQPFNKQKRPYIITLSLTSFPARIETVALAIKSLMLQSVKPDRIVLWLSELQFPDKKLPATLEALVELGLEIKYTSDDLRSHKKYYYALQEQRPKELIISFDDDLIYDADVVSRLINTHLDHPNAVVCDYGNVIVTEGNDIMPYSYWQVDSCIGVDKPSYQVMPYTGAGCLYPYGIMPSITFDKEHLKRVAYTADDLWIKFCSLSNGVPVVKTRKSGPMLCVVTDSQKEHLGQVNCNEGGNNATILKLVHLFPDAVDRLVQNG